MSRDVITGKGQRRDLENLHGVITKVYVKSMESLLDTIEESDKAMEDYKEAIYRATEAGEDTSEIHKPHKFVIDKDTLALLKGGQGFLKENDVQMDIVKGTGAKTLRNKIHDQIKDKLN